MAPLLANARTAGWLSIAGIGLVVSPVSAHPTLSSQIERVTRELAGAQDPHLLLERADFHRLAGHWDLAARDCESALRIAPEMEQAHLCLSRIALGRGDPGTAAREARKFLAHDETAPGYRALSLALTASGDVPGAIDSRRRAIDVATRQEPADFLALARLLVSGDGEGVGLALAALDDGVDRLGPLLALQATAVEIAKDAGHHEEALHRVDEILEAVPRRESWIAERGRILAAAGRNPEAWVAFSEALAAIEDLPPHHRQTDVTRRLEAELVERLRLPEQGSVP